jgi:hypothetical protein
MTLFSPDIMGASTMLTRRRLFLAGSALAASTALPGALLAQAGPLRIEITEGVIEPLPFALPRFIALNSAAADAAADISRVIAADLRGTGLFRQIPKTPISRPSRISTRPSNTPTGRRSTRRR